MTTRPTFLPGWTASCGALLLAALLLGACGGGARLRGAPPGEGPPGAPPPERVTSPEALAARLDNALPAAGGRLLLLGHPEAFVPRIVPALEGGAVREGRFILPTAGPIPDDMVPWLLSLLEASGVAEGDRRSFARSGGAFSGTVGKGRAEFRPLSSLPRMEEPAVLLVETEYFREFYRNDVASPLLLLGKKTLVTLREAGVRPSAVLLYDEVSRPDYPLPFAVMPLLFGEMLRHPERFHDSVPPKWEAFDAAEHDRYFFRHDAALAGYTAFLAEEPGDPSALYRIAMMAARDGAYGAAAGWIGRATEREPAFRKAYVEMADYLAGERKDPEAAEVTLRGALEGFPRDPLIATALAEHLLDRGEAALAHGDAPGAAARFREAGALPGADPAVLRRAADLLGSVPGTAVPVPAPGAGGG